MKNSVKHPARRFTALLLGLLALTQSLAAAAGGVTATVGYQPLSHAAAAIPTLGGAGLIALALLLAVMVWRMQRSGALRNNPLLSIALTVTILATGAAGSHMVVAANFGAAPQILMTNAEGGNAQTSSVGTSCFVNASGADLQITAVTPEVGYLINSVLKDASCPERLIVREGESQELIAEAPDCAPSMQLAPDYACSVTVVFGD